jgi:predicted RNase H-like nuclease (RuvC/YqgF family)
LKALELKTQPKINQIKTLKKELDNEKIKNRLLKEKIATLEKKISEITNNNLELNYDGNQVQKFEATTFRLKSASDIYDGIDGDVLFTWEKSRSFTSTIMSAKWIKITGYFVDKKWQAAPQELWVEKENAIKR